MKTFNYAPIETIDNRILQRVPRQCWFEIYNRHPMPAMGCHCSNTNESIRVNLKESKGKVRRFGNLWIDPYFGMTIHEHLQIA